MDTDSVPTLQNSADVMDFAFDPFNTHRLVVGGFTHTHSHTHTYTYVSTCMHVHTHTACDDAKIRVWTIPDGGLTKTLTDPDYFLIGELARDLCIVFVMSKYVQATRKSPMYSSFILKPEICCCQQDMMEKSFFGTYLGSVLLRRWSPSHSLYVHSLIVFACTMLLS